MVGQYAAIALQSNIPVVKHRDEFREAMKYLYNLLNTAVQHSLEYPVKLVAFVEGSFQGYRDEFIDQDHREYVRDLAIDIPGPETDVLSEWAVQFKTYISATAKAKHPDFPERFFNIAFVIDPHGKVIHKHHKNQVWVKEHSTVPADLYDEWVRIYGDGLDAFFPVARTPIGNIGTTICMEGSFPEVYRGLALNGAEIVTRPGYPEPWVTEGMWEVQNRARALDNTMYMVCANQGTLLRRFGRDHVGGGCGGNSMIVDYRGKIVAELPYTTESFLTGIVNIDALRDHRQNAKFCNFIPYLRAEIYRKLYEQPIWPKNVAIEEPPGKHEAVMGIFDHVVQDLTRRGVYMAPDN